MVHLGSINAPILACASQGVDWYFNGLLERYCCKATVILRGAADEVLQFAESILAQRGVTHGQLHLIPIPG